MISIDRARLLVICPHPDDETLATGLLLQEAIARADDVRVICVTDGERNPIPQWLMERSIHRDRWAQRRRNEACAAMMALGVPLDCVEFWGLPDQGLLRIAENLAWRIRGTMARFRPTLVVAPSLHDLHDDHVAAGLATASASLGRDLDHLSYVIHGRSIERPILRAKHHPIAMTRKRAALDCHQSQLVLSRARMEAICEREESFRYFADDAAMTPAPFRVIRRIAHVLFERHVKRSVRETVAEYQPSIVTTDEVIA